MTHLPRAATPEGRAGFDALLASPRRALLATDFDGTLAPIVADPRAARARPGAVPALISLARERAAVAVLFCGDDLGDLPAFAAVRALCAAGVPGCAVASASEEAPQIEAEADLVVAGPDGIVALLAGIADELEAVAAGQASPGA